MKIFKFGLRLWITVTSILTFIAGWILLAHAPKPVQASSLSTGNGNDVAPFPTLQPLPPLNGNPFNGHGKDGNNFQFQQPFFNQAPQTFRHRPFFSTGGS